MEFHENNSLEEIVFVKLKNDNSSKEINEINSFIESLLQLNYDKKLPAFKISKQKRNIYNYIGLSLESISEKFRESTVSTKSVNTILKHATNTIFMVTDKNWNIRFINSQGEKYFNKENAYFIGENLGDYIPELKKLRKCKSQEFLTKRISVQLRKCADSVDFEPIELSINHDENLDLDRSQVEEYVLSFQLKKTCSEIKDQGVSNKELIVSSPLFTEYDRNKKSLYVVTNTLNVKLDLDEICFFEGDGSYSKIHLMDGKRIVISKNLGEYEKLTLEGFCRVHRSYILNLKHINNFNPQANEVIMNNGSVVAISRRKKSDFRKKWQLFNT